MVSAYGTKGKRTVVNNNVSTPVAWADGNAVTHLNTEDFQIRNNKVMSAQIDVYCTKPFYPKT